MQTIFLKIYFTYITSRVKKTKRKRFFFWWFPPQMAATSGAEPGKIMSQEIHPSLHGSSSTAFQNTSAGSQIVRQYSESTLNSTP